MADEKTLETPPEERTGRRGGEQPSVREDDGADVEDDGFVTVWPGFRNGVRANMGGGRDGR